MEERILDYLLGEMSAKENEEFSNELASNSALMKEVLHTEKTLQLLAESATDRNSNAVPLSLINAIRNQDMQSQEPVVEHQPLPIHNRVLAIAASLTILFGVCFSIYKQNQINQLDSKYTALASDKANLELEFNQMVAAANLQIGKLATYTSKHTRVVPLKSKLEGKDYLGNVYWDQSTQSIYFDITNLPHAPEGSSYQLWALINGKPVDAGLINCHVTDLQLAKQMDGFIQDDQNVNAFAVTLEKAGGSETPSDEMYLYGEI